VERKYNLSDKMSIIQQQSNATIGDNWRTINIDLLDPESSCNFDTASLFPEQAPVSEAEVRALAGQVRQLLKGKDLEGALTGALEGAPYGGDDAVKDIHLQTVTEVLQHIKASEITPMLQRIFKTEGGPDTLDILMKYIYKGMASTTSSNGTTPFSPSRASTMSSRLTPQSTGFSQMSGRPSAGDGSGAQMSVLLSWHEKVVDVAGPGAIVRCMTDRRRV